MDVRIKDGDISVTPTGVYEHVDGIEEAVQRVLIAVLTRRGDFIYDRMLGADYSGLRADDSLLRQKLDMRIKEACADITDTEAEVTSMDAGSMTATLTIRYRDQESITEVDLSGILR